MIRLENWSLVDTGEEYSSPEMIILVFQGNAYGHERFPEGTFIITSRIVSCENGVFKTYSGSEYRLGKVDEEYERLFPNALERILDFK